MTLQFIHDKEGNTTGVYIPIEEWQSLKSKYAELEKAEEAHPSELAEWQKQLLDKRLADHASNPDSSIDFDQMLDEIERDL